MKKNRFKKNYRIATAAYAFVLVVALIVSSASGLPENSSLSAVMTGNIAAPQVSAAQAILTDENGKVLYEKNSSQRAYPASTTKILTCITALYIMEEIKADIDQTVTVPKEAAGVEGSSVYLKAGERITFKDLLYSAMLRSGNDAATAIAVIAGGNEAEFVRLMNKKASEIGCTNSSFINPTGLFDENHYTTLSDMAIIMQAALDNPRCREVLTSVNHTSPATAQNPEGVAMTNRFLYRIRPQQTGTVDIQAAKTGYTAQAMNCCVSYGIMENGRAAICVTAHAWTGDYCIADHLALYGTYCGN